ncbi:hypothetical protein V1509DRAFT_87673 [Lipomyces kononenkoae]
MQKSALVLQIEFDTPSISVPYGERPPLVRVQEPGLDRDNDVVLKGRIIASSPDPATVAASAAAAAGPAFKIKEVKVSFMTRTLLANAGLDNRSILTLYQQTVTVFAATESSSSDQDDVARQKTQLGPIFNDLSSCLFTSVTIPFKICLPKWLPPTLAASSHAKVLHTVTAKIKYAYSQKSISAVILGRTLTNVTKTHRDIPVLVCAPLSTSSTSICSFSNTKSSTKPPLNNLFWKVQVPRCTIAGSHLDVLLKFSLVLPPVATDIMHVKNVTFNIVQEKMRRWSVHDQSSWRVLMGKRGNSDSFLVGDAKRTERSKECLLTPFEVPFQPAPPPLPAPAYSDPPPPPPPSSSSSSSVVAGDTEIYYALRVCLSMREANKTILPSCNTPFLKVSHKVHIKVHLSGRDDGAQKDTCTITVPVIVTNDPLVTASLAARSTAAAAAEPRTDASSSSLEDVTETDDGGQLPSYADAVVESQTIHVLGPLTRRINGWSKDRLTKSPAADLTDESRPDDLPNLQQQT